MELGHEGVVLSELIWQAVWEAVVGIVLRGNRLSSTKVLGGEIAKDRGWYKKDASLREGKMKFYSWSLSLWVDKGGLRIFQCSDGYLFSTFDLIEIFGSITEERDLDLSSLCTFPWVGVCKEKCQFLCRR